MNEPRRTPSLNTPIPRELRIYGTAMSLLRPALSLLLRYRERQGKEDPQRRGERFGFPGRPRPAGPLVWVHAASVGELNAVLPLLSRLIDVRPDIHALVTTGTVTSAAIAAERLPERAFHQYLPMDAVACVRRFLDAWKPSLVVLTEQELWPTLIIESHRRSIPIALVNARMSARTLKRWQLRPAVAAALLDRIDIVLTQTQELAHQLAALGARSVHNVGSLKVDAPPLVATMALRAEIAAAIGPRRWLLAASTHHGEEAIVADAHKRLRAALPDHLTVIVPRHPARGVEIADHLGKMGLRVALRSRGDVPDPASDIYLADTLGELGAFYALAPVALIGGSLIDRGGQNPIEALRLGAAVMTGPSQHNFEEIYAPLIAAGSVREVRSAADLARVTLAWFADEMARRQSVERGLAVLADLGGALDKTLTAILPLLPERTRASPLL